MANDRSPAYQVNFNAAWSAALACAVFSDSAPTTFQVHTTTGALVITAAAPLTAGGTLRYICMGR
jgi:hypothetical protein